MIDFSEGRIQSDTPFTEDEVEFLMAMDRYKRVAQRPFPTWHEVLRVIRELGYRKPERVERKEPRPHSE